MMNPKLWPKSVPHEPMGYDEPVGVDPVLELDQYEKEIYVDKMVVKYSGYFDYNELQELVSEWCRQKKYYRMIQSHKEKLTKTGRSIGLGYHLNKQFTHIHVSVLNVDVNISNMITEIKEIDGQKRRVNKADIEIEFNGFLMTHLRNRWETKANIAFIRGVIDKYVYKLTRSKYPGTVVADANNLAAEFRGFFGTWARRVEGEKTLQRVPSAISEEEQKKTEKAQTETKPETESKKQDKEESQTETPIETKPEENKDNK